MHRPALALLALLAGCGTPQERCIRSATAELRTITELAAEVEANLARGYAWESHEVTRTVWMICDWQPSPVPGEPPRPQYCLEDDTETLRRRIAIDPAAETRKLQGLMAKEAKLTVVNTSRIAACKAEFPE